MYSIKTRHHSRSAFLILFRVLNVAGISQCSENVLSTFQNRFKTMKNYILESFYATKKQVVHFLPHLEALMYIRKGRFSILMIQVTEEKYQTSYSH